MSSSHPTTDSNTLEHLLRARHSCRGFQSRSVPTETVDRLLELAGRAPSWCNTQPWRVVVTSPEVTEEIRSELGAWVLANGVVPDITFPESYEGESLARRRECGWQLYDAVGVERGDRAASMREAARNFELFDAPHLAVVSTERALGTYGAVDCGIYVGNFLLAAESLGLGAIAQAAVAGCAPYLHERFGLGEDRQVVCGIAFGFEDPDHPANRFRTTRAALADTVTRI